MRERECGFDIRRRLCYYMVMIKVIASDLDGTLLPPDKTVPPRVFEIIDRLSEKGIVFIPASGRQLPNLLELFAPAADKIAVIAENGGLAWHNGKIFYENPTSPDAVKYALDIIRGESDLYPLVSCTDCAYYESDYPPFKEILHRSYSSARQVESLDKILGKVTALKISVWDPLTSAKHGGIILPPKIKGLRTMISGYDWLDVSTASANKGEALKAALTYFGASADECAAFGDHMNDLEMLLACGNPYVTANAYPGLKKYIKTEVGSNAEYGVIKKLEEFL